LAETNKTTADFEQIKSDIRNLVESSGKDNAVVYIEGVHEKYPDDLHVKLFCAAHLGKLGFHEKAIRILHKNIDRFPGDKKLILALSRAQEKSVVSEDISEEVKQARVLFSQAEQLRLASSLEQATPLYRKVIELDPNHIGANFNIVCGLLADPRAALVYIDKAIGRCGDRPCFLILKARILFSGLRRTQEAVEVLKRALNQFPNHRGILITLRDLAICTGDLGLAHTVCLDILAKRPDDPDTLYLIGLLKIFFGELTTAKKYFSKIVSLEHLAVPARSALGSIYLLEDNLSEASLQFETLLRQFNTHPLGLMGLAIIKLRGDSNDRHEINLVRQNFNSILGKDKRRSASIEQALLLARLSGIYSSDELRTKTHQLYLRNNPHRKQRIMSPLPRQSKSENFDSESIRQFAEVMAGQRQSKVFEFIGGLDPVDRVAHRVTDGLTGRKHRS
jgi:tetratricopeptide (TPR) repeat protein